MRSLRLFVSLFLGLFIVLLVNVSLARAGIPMENVRVSSVPHTQSMLSPTPIVTVQVPILVYHHVSRSGGYNAGVSLQEFTAQMDWLQQNGYTSVSIDQIASALRGAGQPALPSHPVALTFDDGWSHVYTDAVPVMESHGFRGTFFVVASYSGGRSPAYLSWDQLKALRNAGHWVGAHSMSHPNLNGLSAVALDRQVVISKSEIEKNVGGVVTVFAYPYGANSPRVVQAVQAAGYSAAVAVNPRILQRSDQIYRLNRINMYGGMTLQQFQAFMTGKGVARVAPRPPAHPERASGCRRITGTAMCD